VDVNRTLDVRGQQRFDSLEAHLFFARRLVRTHAAGWVASRTAGARRRLVAGLDWLLVGGPASLTGVPSVGVCRRVGRRRGDGYRGRRWVFRAGALIRGGPAGGGAQCEESEERGGEATLASVLGVHAPLSVSIRGRCVRGLLFFPTRRGSPFDSVICARPRRRASRGTSWSSLPALAWARGRTWQTPW